MDVTTPGRELHARFLSLGDMTGMTRAQIAAVVGNPSSISAAAGGNVLLQWMATGCHMALLFGPDGKFIGITHQFAQYAPPTSTAATVSWIVIIAIIATLIVLGNTH
jgi:hypothetical protein